MTNNRVKNSFILTLTEAKIYIAYKRKPCTISPKEECSNIRERQLTPSPISHDRKISRSSYYRLLLYNTGVKH